MQNTIGGGEWPLVGRAEELELLVKLRSRGLSAVVSGPAGVGKSRLAGAALADAARHGWATLSIRGSVGLAGVPFGPLRTVLRVPGSSDLTEVARAVAHELAVMRSGPGLIVLANGGQDLDDYSAGLIHQLVASRSMVAIITTRTGARTPAALTDTWKDGLAERIELQNLSRRETAELLAAGLGGTVQDSSANRMWHVTGGNPLYLREVVLSSAETGALRQVEGEWRWQGEWATGARLQEIVAARLGRLDPDELTSMEMLALAGSLPFELVTSFTTARAVEGLEGRGLVSVEESGRRLEMSIAHPLHAEVLRSRMPALRQRAIRRNLVEALTRTGARRTADRVRIACWSLESGLDVDPATLSLGSDAALYGIGQAIAGRLQEILPGTAAGLRADAPAVRQDFELAIRLAQVAYERTGQVLEGAALASALAWTGRIGQAEAVLAELAGKAEAIDDRLGVALALSFLRFWGRYDVDEARAALTEVTEAAAQGGSPALIAQAYEQLAGIALNTAQPTAALVYAERAAAAEGVELSRSVAALAAAAALAYLGRCGEAIAFVDQAVPAAREGGNPLAVPTLLFSRAGTLARMGELEPAREMLERIREVTLSDGLLDSTALFGVLLGEVLLRQGLPASAGRIFRDSSGLLAERDLLGYRPWALAGLARARAQVGEQESAVSALEEARRTQPIARHYDASRYLAEIDCHRAAGNIGAAEAAARAGVAWAQAAGIVVDEAYILDAWLRIAPSSALAERLATLAASTDSQLVAVLADHAQAMVAADAEALLVAGERFARMTAWRMAAEAADEAARVFDRRNQARAATAAKQTAARWFDRCEGGRPVAAEGSGGPIQLTKREREIAALAAAGRSSKEIADTMYLSPRTVENHLQRAYIKLGITDRAALAKALAPAEPS